MNYRLHRKLRGDGQADQRSGKKPSVPRRALTALNQPITLFILGTVVIGVATSLFAETRQCFADQESALEEQARIAAEVQWRATNAFGEVKYEMNATRAASRLTRWLSSDSPYLFREYANDRLGALMWRLYRVNDRLEIHKRGPGWRIDYEHGHVIPDRANSFYGPVPFVYELVFGGLPPRQVDMRWDDFFSHQELPSNPGLDEDTFNKANRWLNIITYRPILRISGGCSLSSVVDRLVSGVRP